MEQNFKVLSVLKKYMSEEDFKKFEKGTEFETVLNEDITKYINSNTPKKETLEAEAKLTAHKEVITKLGITGVETVDQLTAHIAGVNSSTTDKDAEVTRLTNELTTKTNEYNTLNKTHGEVNKKVTRSDVMDRLTKAKFGSTFLDDLALVAISKKTDDNDFDNIIANMKTDTHKHYLSSSDFSGSLPGEQKKDNVDISDDEMASWMADAGVKKE